LLDASCGLSGRGRLVIFLRLWQLVGPHDEAEVSLQALALSCGLKEETCQRDLAWLIENGWIRCLRRPGRRNSYQVRRLGGKPQHECNRLQRDKVRGDAKKQVPIKSPPLAKTAPDTPRTRQPRARAPVDPPPDWPSNLSPENEELMSRWWQRRCAGHRRADRTQLGEKTLGAVALATDAGVLREYLLAAVEAGWMSLGHLGTERIISGLQQQACHPGTSMLDSCKPISGHSVRRQKFLDDALRLITPVDDGNGETDP
jgi:hypothetical protein